LNGSDQVKLLRETSSKIFLPSIVSLPCFAKKKAQLAKVKTELNDLFSLWLPKKKARKKFVG